MFETHESAELRDRCLSNGTFSKFIERIGALSTEKKRVKVETLPVVEETKQETTVMKKKPKKEKKDVKRKGVGYTAGVGTTWNVSEYLKSKEAKSS